MTDLLGTGVAAAVVFAGTDVDDLLILTVLFLTSRRTGQPRAWQIVVGQYLGIGVLLVGSAAVAAGLLVVPQRWIGLLGLVPIGFGIRALIRGDDDEAPPLVRGVTGVAAVTIANGADNVAVYVPVLRTLDPRAAAVFLAVFAVLVALWCLLATWLGSHPRVARLVDRSGRWVVPAVFIGIGALILAPLLAALFEG